VNVAPAATDAWELTHYLTHGRMAAGRKVWTLPDGILREIAI